MEDWDGNANWNRDVLERIVALLFALAYLADLAAGAPFFRRRRVLEILSHGEVEARAFLFGGAPVPSDALEDTGDAARLAVRFRALALVLCALLAQVARFAPPGATNAQASQPTHEVSRPAIRWLDAARRPHSTRPEEETASSDSAFVPEQRTFRT